MFLAKSQLIKYYYIIVGCIDKYILWWYSIYINKVFISVLLSMRFGLKTDYISLALAYLGYLYSMIGVYDMKTFDKVGNGICGVTRQDAYQIHVY